MVYFVSICHYQLYFCRVLNIKATIGRHCQGSLDDDAVDTLRGTRAKQTNDDTFTVLHTWLLPQLPTDNLEQQTINIDRNWDILNMFSTQVLAESDA